MDRRKRHLVVMSVAVVTATLASAGMYLTIKRMPVRQVEAAQRLVVVAAHALPPGVRLTTEDVKVVSWPVSSMIAESFSTPDLVVNRALLSSVIENEPLVEGKLARSEEGAGLPPSIPAGMRAMSVKVNDVIGVAGFIDPGTRVDLVVTMRKKDDSVSRTVVSNVQVLKAGTRYDQQKNKDSKAPPTATVVTLLVTPQTAERIALAQAEGTIMLVLRNPLDTAPTETSGVRTAALFGEASEQPAVVKTPVPRKAPALVAAAVAQAPVPPVKIYTVEAIRAAKRTEEVVR